jgi:hypothetical protein
MGAKKSIDKRWVFGGLIEDDYAKTAGIVGQEVVVDTQKQAPARSQADATALIANEEIVA